MPQITDSHVLILILSAAVVFLIVALIRGQAIRHVKIRRQRELLTHIYNTRFITKDIGELYKLRKHGDAGTIALQFCVVMLTEKIQSLSNVEEITVEFEKMCRRYPAVIWLVERNLSRSKNAHLIKQAIGKIGSDSKRFFEHVIGKQNDFTVSAENDVKTLKSSEVFENTLCNGIDS